ncbi:ABC transporter permease [Ahrensia kielensis]|uniref:ABC transporter permease n=1 Tax=Ahrensia kielensis TaxID=76980 RepID=A0ABU9TBV1_9HYPH
MITLIIYLTIISATFFAITVYRKRAATHDFTSLKTVTFGDETAVRPDRIAGVVSVLSVFVLWGIFTGSSLLPSFMHVPAPFKGVTSFTYTVEANGQTDDATVTVLVHERDEKPVSPKVALGDGFAKDDVETVAQWRTVLVRVDRNDDFKKSDDAIIVAINGQSVKPGDEVNVDNGTVTISSQGTPNFNPYRGWQMEPLYLPSPEQVWKRSLKIINEGFRGFTIWEHLGYSLFRVVVGFLLGAAIGIPLGYAMGLSNFFRGWFDPIVEFMRPVPPLALIPLVIIWAGIGETGKIILLFLASLWIMAIAARAGASGVNISKVHAAYSLGASKWQIMRHVIAPNSLPEIFTGARVAMGVCWGTVVAAELVAAEQGAGMMIMTASKFQNTDTVIMGIILIGVIGLGIDVLMRNVERFLVPWKGKS